VFLNKNRMMHNVQKNNTCIQDWLELDEGDPGLQLLIEEEIASDIFYFHQHYIYYWEPG
jgi:hypothetical protein